MESDLANVDKTPGSFVGRNCWVGGAGPRAALEARLRPNDPALLAFRVGVLRGSCFHLLAQVIRIVWRMANKVWRVCSRRGKNCSKSSAAYSSTCQFVYFDVWNAFILMINTKSVDEVRGPSRILHSSTRSNSWLIATQIFRHVSKTSSGKRDIKQNMLSTLRSHMIQQHFQDFIYF